MSRTLRILLVEDSADDVYLFKLAVEKRSIPMEVDTVPDGQEALHYLKRPHSYAGTSSPNLILLDLNLPKLSGREVLRELKQDELLQQIPVIVMTTSHSASDIKDAYKAGASSYLIKPDRFNHLTDYVQKIYDFWSLAQYC